MPLPTLDTSVTSRIASTIAQAESRVIPPPPRRAPGVTAGAQIGLAASYRARLAATPEAREIASYPQSATAYNYDTCTAPQKLYEAPCSEHSLMTAIFQPWRWDMARHYLELHKRSRAMPAEDDVDGWLEWAGTARYFMNEMKLATNLYPITGRHTGWAAHELVRMGIKKLTGLDQPDGVPALDGVPVPAPFRYERLGRALRGWRRGVERSGLPANTPWDPFGVPGRVVQYPMSGGQCRRTTFPLREWLSGPGRTTSAQAFWVYNTRAGAATQHRMPWHNPDCHGGRHDGHEIIVPGFDVWKQWIKLEVADALEWNFAAEIMSGMELWFAALTPFVESGGLDLDPAEWRKQQQKLARARERAKVGQVASIGASATLAAFSINWIAGVVVLIAAVVAVFVTWLVGVFKRKHEPAPCPPPPFIRSLLDKSCSTAQVAGNSGIRSVLEHMDSLTPDFTLVPEKYRTPPPAAPDPQIMVTDPSFELPPPLPLPTAPSSLLVPALVGAGALVGGLILWKTRGA